MYIARFLECSVAEKWLRAMEVQREKHREVTYNLYLARIGQER